MKKVDLAKLNMSNTVIWKNLDEALKTKNWALIENNLQRLYSLQKYYIDELNFIDTEIVQLTNMVKLAETRASQFEALWFKSIAKETGFYRTHKDLIDEIFKEK